MSLQFKILGIDTPSCLFFLFVHCSHCVQSLSHVTCDKFLNIAGAVGQRKRDEFSSLYRPYWLHLLAGWFGANRKINTDALRQLAPLSLLLCLSFYQALE
jgi:hypothetical protein